MFEILKINGIYVQPIPNDFGGCGFLMDKECNYKVCCPFFHSTELCSKAQHQYTCTEEETLIEITNRIHIPDEQKLSAFDS